MSDFWTRRSFAPGKSLWIVCSLAASGCQGAGFLGMGQKQSTEDKRTTLNPKESDQAGARGADKGGSSMGPTTVAPGKPGGENVSPGQQPIPGSETKLPYPVPSSGPGGSSAPGYPGQGPNGVTGSGVGNGSGFIPGGNGPGAAVGGSGSGGGSGGFPGSGSGYGPGYPNEGFPPGTQVPPGVPGWSGNGSGSGGGSGGPGSIVPPIGGNPDEGFPFPKPPPGGGQLGGGSGSFGPGSPNWGGSGSGTSGCLIPLFGCGQTPANPNEGFPVKPPIVVVGPPLVVTPLNPPLLPHFWTPIVKPPQFYPPLPPEPQPPYPAPKGKTWLELTVVQTDHESWWKNCLWVAVEGNQPWKAIACNKDRAANGRTVFLLADEFPACNKVQVFIETYHNQGNICNIRAQQGLPCEGPYAADGKIDYSRNPFFAHEAVFYRAYDRIGIRTPDALIRPNVTWVLGDTNALSQAMTDFRGPVGRNKWLRIFFEDQPRENLDRVVAAPAQWKKYGIDFNDYVFDVKGRNVNFNVVGSGLTCDSR